MVCNAIEVSMSESLSLIDPRRNEISGTSTFTTSLLSPLSLLTTIGVLVPTLLGGIFFLHALTDRLYPATLFSLHMTVELLFGCFQIQNVSKHSQTLSRDATVMFFFFSILDIYLCGWTYPPILNMLENSFVDIDDTILSEWRTFWILLWWLKLGIHLVVMLRLILLSCWMVATISRKSSKWTRNYASRQCLVMFRLQRNWFQQRVLWKQRSYCRSMSTLRKLLVVMTLCSFPLLFLCFRSCSLYLWSQTPEKKSSLDGNYCGFCDDLDDTECALPFPSFHHMRRDASSRTGWRVNLQPTSLPRMKGDQLTELSFLNDLDGFSPMAPILFYIQGLKESQQAQSHGMKSKVYPTLPYAFEDSINNRSATILWDVKTHTLIPHTARVDLLDPEKPIILVFPSKPLNHATHYALAVIDATDAKGRLLSPTAGMQKLLSKNDDDSSTGACSSADIHRRERYLQVLLPSLKQTASWLTARHANHTAPLSPQLLFDFITMSHDSLQPARDIRDATLERVSSRDYEHRVQITKLENENCRHNKTLVARAIHGSISVPWWLTSHDRDAILSKDAMYNADKKYTHPIKFVMYVPCSLYAAATNQTYRKQRPLRAILEYGHGMFYNRAEANDYSLQRVAEDQGYLIMAMDWRGMSSFDMPVVMKSLLAKPALLQSTRDNLIQGYAGKLVLQHFAQDPRFLEQEWLQFSSDNKQHEIPTYDNKPPISIFYGSSQGGILGAAYTALLGPTGLIKRGILGTPGTSFSSIMYQSNSFSLYDALLMQNFYNNREVRIVLSILQLAWDPAGPASFLAPPIQEPYPPMLLQSGLGDPVIPTMATEALARAYNASVLPSNPRLTIFQIPKASLTSALSNEKSATSGQPHVAWTEILYQNEYQGIGTSENLVHECLRQDCALIGQMSEFINTGRILDPCFNDRCLRKTIPCYLKGKSNSKPTDWTCAYDQCS